MSLEQKVGRFRDIRHRDRGAPGDQRVTVVISNPSASSVLKRVVRAMSLEQKVGRFRDIRHRDRGAPGDQRVTVVVSDPSVTSV
jgi:hypothetical protein